MQKRIISLALIMLFLCPGLVWGAEDNPLSQGFIEGYLQKINHPDPAVEGDTGSIAIETYGGAIYTLALNQDCTFSIDNLPVKIGDLRRGMEVYGRLDGEEILTLEAYSTVKLGYIQPGSRVVVGTITGIEIEQLTVRRDDGSVETYFASIAIPITKQGQTVNLDQLYIGDRVKLYFDEMTGTNIVRMEVQGTSILVKDVYKGNMNLIDEAGQHFTLSDVQVLRNSLWESYQPSWRINYATDLPVYCAGQKIAIHNLKYYRGRSVYIVTKQVLGRECIDRMVIKSQYEAAYAAQVKEVNWFSDACELDNNKNISFNNGSIIIKDGRLQDKFAITEGTDAYFITDSMGTQRLASLVLIYNSGVNNSNAGQTCIYAGQLSDIFEDSFWIEDPYKLDNNAWDDESDMEFYLDNDTGIYDMDNMRTLTISEFAGGDYSVDEDSDRAEDNDLENWYAYVIAMGDRAACVGVYQEEEELEGQRVTSGIIGTIENSNAVGWTASLRDCSDWSEHKEKWMVKNANLSIGVNNALIMRNGKIISPRELKVGERLYLVRDDYYAKVIVVK